MIAAIKFIHILLTLSILGTAIYCLTAVSTQKSVAIINRKIILSLVLLAMITGTLLVYPKHYTFHTPWIQAAYVFLVLFSLGMVGLLKKHRQKNIITSPKERFFYLIGYLLLIIILILIIHDAVTKTTFL